jgi:biopolymer transport protein ExbD
VFFAMLTLRMIPSSGQLSKLPTSSTTSTLPAPKLLIEIQANSQLMAEGSSRTQDEIRALIQRKDASKLAVTIAGGEDTSMQRVMDVIDVVKTSGVTQVGLAARHPTR